MIRFQVKHFWQNVFTGMPVCPIVYDAKVVWQQNFIIAKVHFLLCN